MEGFRVVEAPVSTNPRFSGTSHYGIWNRLCKSFRRPACSPLDEARRIQHEIAESVKAPMNTLALIAITWIGKEYRFVGLDWSYLMVLGFIGNALFSMRFLVQWLASERQGESIIPVSFWYWSIAGSVLMG